MSLPTKARTWAHFHSAALSRPALANAALIADLYNRQIIVEVVRQLVTSSGSAGHWSHIASSNNSAVSTTAGDNKWTDGTTGYAENLAFGTAISGYTSQVEGQSPVGTPNAQAGSWIVLKAPNFFGSNVPLYMTLQLGKLGLVAACSIFLSRTEPSTSAATTTVRPVPTNGLELTYRTSMTPQTGTPTANHSFLIGAFGTVPLAGGWATNSSLNYLPNTVRVHTLRSDKGFRFFAKAGEIPFFMGAVDFVDGAYADASEMPPVAMFWESSSVATIIPFTSTPVPVTSTKYWKDRRVRMYRDAGGAPVPVDCYMSQECHGDGADPVASTAATNPLSGQNDLDPDSNYPLYPIGIISTCTNAVGRHGYIQDLYWGSDRHLPLALYPDAGSKTWIQVGSLVMPWDNQETI